MRTLGQNGLKFIQNLLKFIPPIPGQDFTLWQCFLVFLLITTKYRSSHSQMFYKIGVLKNFTKFIGKHLCWSHFLIKLQAPKVCNFIKRPLYRCFPVNFVEFFKTPFSKNTSGRLLLRTVWSIEKSGTP